jgi:hypothetical protein
MIWFQKRPALWQAIVMLCSIFVLAVSGCTSASSASTRSTTSVAHPTATAIASTITPIPTAFPAFHDWRVAYVSSNDYFHAVTLDGKTDVTGARFPGFENGTGAVFSAGASPDGHYIAYMEGVTLAIYDVRAQTPPADALHTGRKYLPTVMLWSPDSQRLALGDEGFTSNSTHIVSVVPITIPEPPPVPGTSAPVTGPYIYPEGWIDNHTLLMYTNIVQSRNPFTTTALIEALDISTGATRTIATFPHGERSNFDFVLSPDGQEVFLYTFPAHDQPFTPMTEIINTATGAMHPLPTLAGLQLQPGAVVTAVAAAAWRPGMHDLALTLGGVVDPAVPTAADFLVDTDTGAYVPINSTDFVQAWSPDGSTLVLSNATNNENGSGEGPDTLTAVTFSSSGQAILTPLTHDSMFFTFLGFIRSA